MIVKKYNLKSPVKKADFPVFYVHDSASQTPAVQYITHESPSGGFRVLTFRRWLFPPDCPHYYDGYTRREKKMRP